MTLTQGLFPLRSTLKKLELYYLLCLLLCLYVAAVTTSPLESVADDTFLDDEDNLHSGTGEFTLTIFTALRCDQWQIANVADQTIKANIREAVIRAVRQNCQCDFNSQHIASNEITCSTHSGDTMFYSGEVSPGSLSSKYDVHSLLKFIEEWVDGQPVLTLAVEVFSTVSINITVLEISTVVGSGSGDADLSSRDGFGSTGSGSGHTGLFPGPDSTEDGLTTTETNQRDRQTPTSFGMVCTPSVITFLSFILVIFLLENV